jgi:hypothetical protein
MYPTAHTHLPIDLVSSGDSPMLIPQNLILNRPILAPLTDAEPGQEYSLVPSLPCEFLIAAPGEEDEEEDEIDPEDTEDHIDEQEEDEDEEDYQDEDDDDDEDDDEDDEVIDDGEEEEEEDDEDDDDDEDEEHDPDSDSVEFFMHPAHAIPRNQMVQ